MQSDCATLTLGDLVSLVRGNTYKSALLGQPGPILLGLASIQRDGGFRGDSLKTYGGESAEKLLLRPGDLYVSLKDVTQSGDLLGAIARLPKSVPLGRLTQDTVKLQFDAARYPAELLYWTLRCPDYRAYCRERAIGTTNLSLSRDDFLAFPLPAAATKRMEMVALLEALEHRIDLLRQINATHESIAQALFKSWFVDFDPVHAKAQGREPEGMDAATAALFPAEFEASALGLIPKGWQARSLDSFATYLNGLALQRFPPESDDEYLPVIKIAQLRAGNTVGADRASARLKPEYMVRDGDVLFSWSGSLEVEFWCGGDGALNQHLFRVTSDEVPKWFYYLATRHFLPGFREIAAHKATTMGHIQRKHLTEAKIALPPASLMSELGRIAAPLLERRVANALLARELANIRDALLPRLISGKLRLPEAQEQVEEATA
ncbi:MAG TPA: restriction endonuclease subunit S [Rubrivivax sp.]|nr:restriction endonuclease subunit S [Rubrivivax sp.]